MLKDELKNLSQDVVCMSDKMNESLKGFGWVVSERLQDLQLRTDDINGMLFCNEYLSSNNRLWHVKKSFGSSWYCS